MEQVEYYYKKVSQLLLPGAFTSTEQNYAAIEKECLATCHATEKFHHYIIGKDTQVETDQKPLKIIFQKSLLNAPKRLQRMLLKLQRYNLKVSYKRGKEMYIADLLSRTFNNNSQNSTNSKVEHFHIFNQDLENVNFTDYLNFSDQNIIRHSRTFYDFKRKRLKTFC